MILPSIFVLLGFVLLIKGADWLVSGASALAKKYNISDLVIGLTIVAFGTSAPELVVNSIASFNHLPDIVLGNIIGSNNFNLFLILGIVGLISPIVVQNSTVWKEIPISFIAAVALLFLAKISFFESSSFITRIDATILLIMFGIFLYYIFLQLKNNDLEVEKVAVNFTNIKIWTLIAVGLAGLVLGGKLVVDNAVELAKMLGVSEKIIGLTIVAAGTSLPELVTSVVAALKKNSDIAIGNVIGSNIFNILLILSISAYINPVSYNSKFDFDIYFLLGGTLFLFIAMFTGKRKKLDRWEALLLLIAFIFYTVYLVIADI